jgi:hypothetical protein
MKKVIEICIIIFIIVPINVFYATINEAYWFIKRLKK